MPVYDFACPACHWQGEDLVPVGTLINCPQCQTPTEKMWTSRAAGVEQVTYPGGLTVENGFAHPRTFYSRAEHMAALKEAGLTPMVRHVGLQGSDRSPHTTRWVSGPTITEEERLAHLRDYEAKLAAERGQG